jgi:hypothetical protein
MLKKQLRQRIGRSREQRGKRSCVYIFILLIILIFYMPTISKAICVPACPPPPPPSATLTVTTSGRGIGTVTSSSPGINCGGDCSESYDPGAGIVVALTATPDSGSVFAGWSGNPDCSDGLVTMDADKTCTASFDPLYAAWEISPIDSSSGSYSSIAIDSNNKVHVAYEARHYDGINGDLKYATNATGQWVTTTVDSSGGVGISASVAIDSNGRVHISYYDRLSLDLKHATNATGSWVTTTVDSLGDVGATTSIAVDSRDKVHIIYLDRTSGVTLKVSPSILPSTRVISSISPTVITLTET